MQLIWHFNMTPGDYARRICNGEFAFLEHLCIIYSTLTASFTLQLKQHLASRKELAIQFLNCVLGTF